LYGVLERQPPSEGGLCISIRVRRFFLGNKSANGIYPHSAWRSSLKLNRPRVCTGVASEYCTRSRINVATAEYDFVGRTRNLRKAKPNEEASIYNPVAQYPRITLWPLLSFGARFPLRSWRTDLALLSLGTFGTGRSWKSGRAFGTYLPGWASVALRSRGARLALRAWFALRSRGTRLTSWTRGARLALRAWIALRSRGTRLASWTRGTRLTLRAWIALRSRGTRLTSWTRGARLALRALGSRWTHRADR
jgi:hypothetical protein